MRNEKAKTRNIRRLRIVYEEVIGQSSIRRERFVLIYGDHGNGKSTAVAELNAEVGEIYWRTTTTGGIKTMLFDIGRKLGINLEGTSGQMERDIIDQMKDSQKALFIDDAERLNKRMLETLQLIHDESERPVFLIAPTSFLRTLEKKYPAIKSRIHNRTILFEPCSIGDLRKVVTTCCEVAIADDLLNAVKEATDGNMRYVIAELTTIENYAKLEGLQTIELSQYYEIKKKLETPKDDEKLETPQTNKEIETRQGNEQ